MAVTSPVRTVIDLSSRLGVDGTGRLVDDMLRRKLLTIAALRERLLGLRAAPGRSMRVLRAVVAVRDTTYDPGESTLEARIRRVIARKRFPSPVGQHWVRDRGFAVRLDFAYPDVKVYLEGDGFGFHHTRSDLDRDVRRRNGLVERGWIGLHFTWKMTDAEIERHLAALYDRATQAVAAPPVTPPGRVVAFVHDPPVGVASPHERGDSRPPGGHGRCVRRSETPAVDAARPPSRRRCRRPHGDAFGHSASPGARSANERGLAARIRGTGPWPPARWRGRPSGRLPCPR